VALRMVYVMTDLANLITAAVQPASEALHELKRSPDRKPKREKAKPATEADFSFEGEPVGEGPDENEHELDVKA
jgi:hypothetical protein